MGGFDRYAEELIRREQQQQQMMMSEGLQDGRWKNSNSAASRSSSPDTPPPTKKRRQRQDPGEAASPAARAPLLPAENNMDAMSAACDVTAVTSSPATRQVTMQPPSSSAILNHVMMTSQFACPCAHCRNSKPTYIVPLDIVSSQLIDRPNVAHM